MDPDVRKLLNQFLFIVFFCCGLAWMSWVKNVCFPVSVAAQKTTDHFMAFLCGPDALWTVSTITILYFALPVIFITLSRAANQRSEHKKALAFRSTPQKNYPLQTAKNVYRNCSWFFLVLGFLLLSSVYLLFSAEDVPVLFGLSILGIILCGFGIALFSTYSRIKRGELSEFKIPNELRTSISEAIELILDESTQWGTPRSRLRGVFILTQGRKLTLESFDNHTVSLRLHGFTRSSSEAFARSAIDKASELSKSRP